MARLISIYGKGGIGKSTTVSNLSVCLARRGLKVLQVGCDPKHDSTFPVTGRFIPTVIEVLSSRDFHYENIAPGDIVFPGYLGVRAVEAGGPPAGTGCAGYVIGETLKLLERMDVFSGYDVVLFDVLGDVVCGGFSVPLQYSRYACVIVTDDFDSFFAANRIVAGIVEKAKVSPVRLAGLIANRSVRSERLERFAADLGTRVIAAIGDSELIKRARQTGKTAAELAETAPDLLPLVGNYDAIAEFLAGGDEAAMPSGETAAFLDDRTMFERYMGN